MKNYLRNIPILFSLLCFISIITIVESVYSQTPPRSTRGKEFWISWPYDDSRLNSFGDENFTNCNIYVFSTKPTNGYYEYLDNGKTKRINFRLNDTNNYFFGEALVIEKEVKISEFAQKQSVYVYSDDSINVYATSMSDSFRLDATIVFPNSALGREYYIVTRKQGLAKTQFLIVAPYDSTRIEITPTATTEYGKLPNIPFTITLQRGQTYLVRSNGDLTGSRVRAIGEKNCFPIAVFTSSPQTSVGECPPNNFLWEQIPPDAVVGSGYVIPKYPKTYGSIIRALAVHNGTQIRMDGHNIGQPLNVGQFVEMETDSFSYVNGNRPFMLAHFTKGGGCVTPTIAPPTMTILSAVSQLQRFASIYAPAGNLFFHTDSSTVNIVVKYAERGVTRINGSPVDPSKWRILPGNPIYATYQLQLAINNVLRIYNDLSGFTASIYGTVEGQSFTMTAGGDFSQTIVGGLDTAGIYGKTTFCKGEVANLRALVDPSATSYKWEYGDGTSDTGRTVSHVYKNAGNYFLRLIIFRGAFCAYDTTRRLITVRASPVVKAGTKPTILLCNNQTATLGISQLPGVTYRWSPAIGLSDTTIGQPTVTVIQDEVTYIVRGYDSFGCETRDTVTVRAYRQPIANAGPDTVSCGGNGVQIGRQTTGGTPNYSFLWTPATGLSNDKIERPIATPTANTTYILRVTDVNGCIGYDTVNIQALPSPTINIATAPTICEGDSVQL
ncbi:MAG: PKD domain-containing protein, partial [Candidatus Kapabacteria bacterium]|nr:PKD domain-containing protein [Candidatus Kapabacteria bacterium]